MRLSLRITLKNMVCVKSEETEPFFTVFVSLFRIPGAQSVGEHMYFGHQCVL